MQIIPAREHRQEISVKNSRFIAAIAPAFQVEQARDFINRIKKEFPDATHHVPAFIIGHGQSVVEHCHDDGEPSGTAGRPLLSVLRGSGLGDAVVVVTRYFGGTKLGKGGLVRAYGDALRAALETLPRAEKVPTHTLLVTIPYALFEPTRQVVEAHHGRVLGQNFAGEVTLSVQIATGRTASFQKALHELSRGKIEGKIIETNRETILPLA